MFVLPITIPTQVEKSDRYCKCGKRLSYYNEEFECYSCQKKGKSMDELNEILAETVAESRQRTFTVSVYSKVALSDEVWDNFKRKMESDLKKLCRLEIKVTDRL